MSPALRRLALAFLPIPRTYRPKPHGVGGYVGHGPSARELPPRPPTGVPSSSSRGGAR